MIKLLKLVTNKNLNISPWIKTRLNLFIFLAIDLFIITYFIIYKYNFYLINKNLNAFLLTSVIWIFYSYIYGRFSTLDNHLDKNKELKLLRNSLIALILTFLSLLLYKNFENFLYVEIFNFSNIYSFLVDISLAGLFGDLIILFIYKNNFKKHKKTILLIDEKNKFKDISFLNSENEKVARINFINSKNQEQIVEETNFSDVIILDDVLKEDSEAICKEMISKGVRIMSFVKWFEFNFNRIPPDMLNVVKYYESRSIPTDKTFEKRLKRFGDVSFSLFLIIITSPIVLILIFFIKLEDKGPIFYTQMRSGFKNKPFKLWKFRSMKENSEKSGPQWAKANDSRVTKIGFIMRKTRLDEIPQLLNVLLGDMSLIGPRPERPEIDSELTESMNLYLERYTIRPGLSGWAQVNYPYGASIEDSKNKLSFDLFYIKNFSFWLDMAIVFKTLKIVLNAKGAYPKIKK